MPDIAASHVLWPDGTLAPGVVHTEGTRIAAVGRPGRTAPERILAPGFVDLQVNGHDDVDVATAAGDDWARLDEMLIDQGVTSWCPTLTTDVAERTDAALERVHSAARRDGARPTIAGVHMEGPHLGGRHGAHPSELVRPPDPRTIGELPDLVRVVTLGPEAEGAVDAVAELAARGVLVSMGHSDAPYEVALAAVDAGARLVTHAFNAMAPLHHREPGLVGVALGDDRVALSMIADLVHVHPAVMRIAVRSKPPGGVVLVTDAVAWRAGRLGDRSIGLVDGAPRLADGTLAGSSLTMDTAVRNLVRSGAAEIGAALAAASTTPARLLGIGDRGTIRVGARADLVSLGLDLTVRSVWIGGEQVRG